MREPDVILLTDIDNTLYDFVDFYGTSFRAMLHVVARELRASEDSLCRQFKTVFQETGTLDYQFIIQRLESVRSLPPERVSRLVRYGRIGFDRAKRKRLIAYPGTIEVLRTLSRGGVRIIGVTNAPYYHAVRRLQDIGAFEFFSGLVAWEGKAPPSEDKDAAVRYKKVRDFAARKLRFFEVFTKAHSKPDPFPFTLIEKQIGTNAITFCLGDSVSKDLAPSSRLRASTIWARYGTVVNEKNLNTVLQITPWTEGDIQRHSMMEFFPDFVIDAPSEILPIIPHWRSDLFQ